MENLGRLGFFVGILTFNPASDTTFPTNSSSLKPNEHLVALRNKLCFLKRLNVIQIRHWCPQK